MSTDDTRHPEQARARRRARPMGLGGTGRSSEGGLRLSSTYDADEQELERLQDDLAAERSGGELVADALDAKDSGYTPAGVMKEIEQTSTTYQEEYRLKMVFKALSRDLPLHEVAKSLGVSLRTVYRLRSRVQDIIKEQAAGLDMNQLVGESMMLYRNITAAALRMASMNNTPAAIKLSALRTAASTNNDMHRMLQTAGVHDALPYKPAQSKETSDIERLMLTTRALLENAAEDKVDVGDLLSDDNEGLSEEDIELL